MNDDKRTKKYFENWQKLTLSDSSRARIEENLLDYARFHGVREEETSRLKEQVPQRTSFFTRFNVRTMPVIAIIAVLMVGGGTSFAAQGSLPGDLLYPVKVEVNENIKSALALSSESEARLQARLLEERIAEAEALEAEGRLEGELAVAVKSNVEAQRNEATMASNESEATVAVDTRNSVRLAIARFNALIGESSLAIRTGDNFAMDESEDGDLSVSTSMMFSKEVVVEELRPQTEMRINGLAEVIAKHKSEIKADVYAEMDAQLTDGLELLARSRTQAKAEATDSVLVAAELAGSVEGTLSTLGRVKINENTGAIVDVDFSQKPEPIDYPILIDPMPVSDPANGGGSSQGSTGAGVSGNAGIDIGISDDMIEFDGETSVGIEATSVIGN